MFTRKPFSSRSIARLSTDYFNQVANRPFPNGIPKRFIVERQTRLNTLPSRKVGIRAVVKWFGHWYFGQCFKKRIRHPTMYKCMWIKKTQLQCWSSITTFYTRGKSRVLQALKQKGRDLLWLWKLSEVQNRPHKMTCVLHFLKRQIRMTLL